MEWKMNSLSKIRFLLIAIMCIACSSSDDGTKEEPVSGEIDPALVGTWVGTIDGGLGEAEIIIDLKSNGTMSGEGANSPYCPLNAKWEVKESSFVAKGNDNCDGTSVTLTAPYSKTELKGKWSASSGNNGTFSVKKE
ncbi:hypothetical protein [uncultured Allomuricauda sp.]|uniref:hypothetical protein n=1 Tax=Flagellimonas sp. W118 TaxID=3410791 RepID=UPI002613CBEF|nr:hypothetical protein [uncultured Allomuricauda sp.]